MLSEIVEEVNKIELALKTLKLDLVFSIILNLVIIAILFKLTNVFIDKLKLLAQKKEDNLLSGRLIPILNKTIKFLILFFVIASFLQSNGYSITSLIAGFGITGLAIGFAAQQTVADFFGTLTIMADKMYKIGDYIKIDNIEGTVEDVNLLSTKIRTLDDFIVFIPNNNVSSATIMNLTRANKRRIFESFTLTYDTSDEKLQQAIDIVKNVCIENGKIHKNPMVYVETLSASSIDIRLFAYAKTKSTSELAQIRSEIILETVKQFRKAEISFAFPSQSIYIEKK